METTKTSTEVPESLTTRLCISKSIISRLQELLKQSNDKYNSLLLASNTELSEHRASYRALSEENEKLREEKDTLLNIYNTVLKENENLSRGQSDVSIDQGNGPGHIRIPQRIRNQNHNVTMSLLSLF